MRHTFIERQTRYFCQSTNLLKLFMIIDNKATSVHRPLNGGSISLAFSVQHDSELLLRKGCCWDEQRLWELNQGKHVLQCCRRCVAPSHTLLLVICRLAWHTIGILAVWWYVGWHLGINYSELGGRLAVARTQLRRVKTRRIQVYGMYIRLSW